MPLGHDNQAPFSSKRAGKEACFENDVIAYRLYISPFHFHRIVWREDKNSEIGLPCNFEEFWKNDTGRRKTLLPGHYIGNIFDVTLHIVNQPGTFP